MLKKPDENNNEDLIKALMKFIKNFFNKGDDGYDHNEALDKFRKDITEHLMEKDDNSELKNWVNKNSAEFLNKMVDFADENKKDLKKLYDENKYGEIYDKVLNGVAKDLNIAMDVSELPANIAGNPNRRNPAEIANSLEDVKGLLEEVDFEGADEILDTISTHQEASLESAPKSGFEKDNNKDFDSKPDLSPSRNRGMDNDNTPSVDI